MGRLRQPPLTQERQLGGGDGGGEGRGVVRACGVDSGSVFRTAGGLAIDGGLLRGLLALNTEGFRAIRS